MSRATASRAEALKEEGNALLKSGDVDGAHDKYSEAIELEPTNHILYSNRSATLQKLGQFSAALADANKCVDLAPNWGKGYSRLAAAFEGAGEIAKAEKAHARARELGHVPAPEPAIGGARSSGTRAGTASAGAGETGGAASGLDRPLLALRCFFAGNALLFLVPVAGEGGFSRALLAVALCYMLELYQLYGLPSREVAYVQKLVIDFRPHFIMTALLFAFSGHPALLPLIPHVLSEAGHVADALMRYRPEIAARVAPAFESALLPRFTQTEPQEWAALSRKAKWTRYNERALEYTGVIEVGIALSLLVEMLTPRRNLLVLFGYLHFMRLRYMVSEPVKSTFKALDARALSLVARVPALLAAYQKLRTFLASLVALPTPEEARARQEAGILGNLKNSLSSCSIS